MTRRILGFVFARGGSKGIPRKNLRLLGGKPLVAHSIEAAVKSSRIERVFISTDDPEIASVAKSYGAEVPFLRPVELARDDSPEWLAWRHAIQSVPLKDDDVFVSIPPTSPMRLPSDIDTCVDTLLKSDADVVLTATPARRNPHFNMIVMDPMGYAHLAASGGTFHTRQSAPHMYDVTTVAYAARPNFIVKAHGLFDGKVRAVLIPPERSLDIDTEMDFKFAEFCLSNK